MKPVFMSMKQDELTFTFQGDGFFMIHVLKIGNGQLENAIPAIIAAKDQKFKSRKVDKYGKPPLKS